MCGICGVFSYDKVIESAGLIRPMLAKLAHRGPDFEDTFQHSSIVLGHRRLSIIDLSTNANQPMHDSNTGVTIVFNGAIYNYLQLRKDLIGLGHSFFSHGDTEVILRSYLHWGKNFVHRLDGMFAFAIWDPRDKSLFLARDRFGIKPLYFSQNQTFFAFASNVQALLTLPNIDTTLNPEALNFQFSLHAVIPAPNTVLNGIKKLEPGHSLLIKKDKTSQKSRYWQLSSKSSEKHTEDEWLEAVEEKLIQAVKKRMLIADVPVGVLLSGGLDSSLIVALLAEQEIDNLHTFSIGFSDIGDEKGSEFEFSDQVVERYQTIHQKITIDNNQVLSRLPEAIAQMSEPMFGQDAIAFYLLSEQVSKHVKVVLSGQGADELFAGYFWYPLMQNDNGSGVQKFSRHYLDRDYTEYQQFIKPQFITGNHTEEFLSKYFDKPSTDDFLNQVLQLDISTLIVDDPVKRVDNMTMAFGLEARVPFLDHHLVELVNNIPSHYKLAQSGLKHLLKRISRGRIPDAIIDRPKGYFPMPALKYVRGDFLSMMQDALTSQRSRQRGLYQQQYINRLIDEPENELNMTRLHGSKLWHAALFELWLQQHNI